MKAVRALWMFGIAFFIYAAVAAVVSVLAGWPAQFGGAGDPANVGGEFLSRGTAIAPPLVPLVALGGGALLVRKGGWWGAVGAVTLLLLGVVFVIGGLGEALAPSPLTAPRVVLVVGAVLAVGGGVTLASLSVAALVAMRRIQAGPVEG